MCTHSCVAECSSKVRPLITDVVSELAFEPSTMELESSSTITCFKLHCNRIMTGLRVLKKSKDYNVVSSMRLHTRNKISIAKKKL